MARKNFLITLLLCAFSVSLFAREIVVGVETIPKRNMALIFTPVVLPDLFSFKAAFEYRLLDKLNLIIPLEAKWMDYRRAIKLAAKVFNQPDNIPEHWYRENATRKLLWNWDMSQMKLSTGVGVKYFPFSESMTNAFYIKTLLMAGIERFHAYGKEGTQDSAVFTHVLTIGYNWVKGNRFTFGIEAGEEYTLHTNPINNIPILISGLMPILHFNLGFTI